MDAKGKQSNITPYTWGLCGAVIGVSRHHHGIGCSISCTRWWTCYKKRRFICPHKTIYKRGATMTCLLSLTALGASYFPSLHPLILLQWRYAFIKSKGPKSFLAPKLGVGMPGLIWLNTLVVECAWMLAFVHASAYALLLFEFSVVCNLTAVKEMILGD